MAAGSSWRHDAGRFVAMPLGGIGTGSIALGADGGLRQVQLRNVGDHLGELPDTFFCIRATRTEPPLDVVRVLQAPPPDTAGTTPLVNDDAVPEWQRSLLSRERGVDASTLTACYPIARLDYHDVELPVEVSLSAFNPLVPSDVETSSVPAALFEFTIRNPGPIGVHGWLGATLRNDVGADRGAHVNRLRRRDGWTRLLMDNPSLADLDPDFGQLALAVDRPAASALVRWNEPGEFLRFLRARVVDRDAERVMIAPHTADRQRGGSSGSRSGSAVDGGGRNGGLAVPFDLAAGEATRVRVVLAWHFPNRYVDFEQFGPPQPQWGPTRFWLGTEYAQRFVDAEDVAGHAADHWDDWRHGTQQWVDTLSTATLPEGLADRLATQAVPLRTPTVFRDAQGRFFGFEGVLGASTTMWSGDAGGSCPLNCTHVWNYEQALSRLFPTLERSMRETEFDVMQAPEGYLPHRVIAPTYLPQLWNVPIGGPEQPALDGMLGAVLKTYREVRNGAGEAWRKRYWPHVVRLLDHVTSTWDPDGTGVLRGIQPSTHDIDLRGVNPFMGTYWLAALRAGEELARLAGNDAPADRWHTLFERGSAAYDERLWNGSYYRQVLDPGESDEYQWGPGCLSDQLIGQWWAHQLGLGYVLPRDHVRTALRSVVQHNLRHDFGVPGHPFRVYADGDDTGLLMCSWPDGGRPVVPLRYADEVWSGIEWQVAAHCVHEGLRDEATAILSGLWQRHDGRKRNPFNELECGDHYARSLAGWSVLEAVTGQQYDAPRGRLCFRDEPGARWPFVAGDAWGQVRIGEHEVTLDVRAGRLQLQGFTVTGTRRHDWNEPIALAAGQTLTLQRS